MCSLGALAKVSPGVTILLKSGEKVSFAFTEKPVIVTGSSAVSVSVGGMERVSYPYTDFSRILFEGVEITAIELPSVEKSVPHAVFLVENDVLHANGLKVGERVMVYSLNGMLVTSSEANSVGCVHFQLSQLPKGVLVIRTQGGISYKLMNYQK